MVLTRVKRDNPKVELCLDRLNILEILYQTDNLNLKNVMILRGLDNYLKELLTIIKELHSAQILDTEAFSRLCYLCEDEDGIDQAFTETYERLYHILVILRSQGLLNSSNFIILCEMNQEDTSFVSYDFAILEKLMKIFDQHNILSQQLFENIIAIIPASRNFQQQLLTSVTALQKNKLLHFFDALVENIGNLQNRIALIIRLDTAELLNAQSLENIISLIQEGLADSLINMIEILDRHQILTDDLLNQLINEKQKDDQRWSAYQLEDLHECIEILRDFGLLNRGNVATIIQFPLKQLSSFLAGLAVLAKTDLILQRYLDILFVEKNPQFYSCFVVLEHLKISMNEMQREKIITIENPGRIFTYLHDNNLLTQDNFDQFFSKDDGFDYLCYSLGVLGFLSSIDQEELDHLLNQTANNLDELQSFLHFILTKQLDSLNLIQLLNTNNIATIKNYVMLLFDLSIENGVISDLYNQILRNPESINVVVAATTRICHPNHGFNIRIQDLQQILDAGMDAENRATLLITEREDEGSEAQSEFEAYEYDESNRGEGLHTASRTSWMQTYEDLLNDNLTAEVFFTSSSDRRNYERSGGRAFEHAEHGPEARAQAIGLQMTIMPYLSHVISGKQLIQIIDRLINAVTQIPDPNLKRHCKFAVDRLLRDSETDISSSLTGRQILIGSWLYLEDSRYYITDIAEYNTFWIGVISYIAAEDDEVEAIDTSIELSFDLGVFAGDPDMRNFQGLSPACYARVRNISAAIVAIDMGRRDKQRIIAGIDSPDDVIKKSIPIAGASMIEASIKSIEMLRMVKANLAGDNLANYTTENHEILHHYLEYDYFQPDTDVLLYDLLQLDGPLLESFKQGLRVLSTFKHKIQEYKERFTTEDPDILYDINRQLISNIATLEELLDEIKSIPAETNQAPRIEPPSAKRRRLI